MFPHVSPSHFATHTACCSIHVTSTSAMSFIPSWNTRHHHWLRACKSTYCWLCCPTPPPHPRPIPAMPCNGQDLNRDEGESTWPGYEEGRARLFIWPKACRAICIADVRPPQTPHPTPQPTPPPLLPCMTTLLCCGSAGHFTQCCCTQRSPDQASRPCS